MTLEERARRVAHEVLLEPLDVSATRIAAAIREAVAAEREACATVAENECSYEAPTYAEIEAGRSIARAIRARGTETTQ